MARKILNIWGVSEETQLRMRLLCAVRGTSMGKLLDFLVEREWKDNKVEITKRKKRKITKIIERFGKTNIGGKI